MHVGQSSGGKRISWITHWHHYRSHYLPRSLSETPPSSSSSIFYQMYELVYRGWVNMTGHRSIIGFLNSYMYLVFLTSGGLWRKMTLLMSLFIVLILVLASLSSPLSLSPSSLSSTSSSLSPSSLASSTARQHIKVRLGGRTAWDNIDWTSMTGHNGKGYFSSSFKLLLFCIF